MAGFAPTRQTLRHLRRLCNASDFIATPDSLLKTSICTVTRLMRTNLRKGPHFSVRDQFRAFSSAPTTLQQSSPRSDSMTNNEPPSAPLPDITNFYTLFPTTLPSGPPPMGPFIIPLPALKREFLRLQSQHHPDKYTTSPTSHSKSLALSSLLNNAYKTLSDPLLRARYLLAHTYNIDITSEDNATHNGVTDPATLIEVMEAQESIEEAHTQEQIDALKDQNRARIQEAEGKLGLAFETEDVETAKTECVKLNYWRSLQQGLDDWEPGKDIRLIH